MVSFRELKRLYKKARDEHKDRFIIDDALGKNEIPTYVAGKLIENLEKENFPEDVQFGIIDGKRLSPEAQDAFKRVSNKISERFADSILKEFDMFRKGFEVDALESEDKLHPIWKELNLVQERSFLEALVHRAEVAVDRCDCVELALYNDSINETMDAVMGFAAEKIRDGIRNKTMDKEKFATVGIALTKDFADVKSRARHSISRFAKTCTCQKNIIKK